LGETAELPRRSEQVECGVGNVEREQHAALEVVVDDCISDFFHRDVSARSAFAARVLNCCSPLNERPSVCRPRAHFHNASVIVISPSLSSLRRPQSNEGRDTAAQISCRFFPRYDAQIFRHVGHKIFTSQTTPFTATMSESFNAPPNQSKAIDRAAEAADGQEPLLARPDLLSHIQAATARARNASNIAHDAADQPRVTLLFLIGVLVVNFCGMAALFALPRRIAVWSDIPERHYLDLLDQTVAICFFLASCFDAIVFSFLAARHGKTHDRRGCAFRPCECFQCIPRS
jgi:hypothetical protein